MIIVYVLYNMNKQPKDTKSPVRIISKKNGYKVEKNYPRLTIERWGEDEDGHITFIDLHDEKFGEAIFFSDGSRHKHGFMNKGKYI